MSLYSHSFFGSKFSSVITTRHRCMKSVDPLLSNLFHRSLIPCLQLASLTQWKSVPSRFISWFNDDSLYHVLLMFSEHVVCFQFCYVEYLCSYNPWHFELMPFFLGILIFNPWIHLSHHLPLSSGPRNRFSLWAFRAQWLRARKPRTLKIYWRTLRGKGVSFCAIVQVSGAIIRTKQKNSRHLVGLREELISFWEWKGRRKMKHKVQPEEVAQDGNSPRSWTHLLPWTYRIYSYACNNFLWKRSEN